MPDLRFLSFFSALMLFWQFFRQRTIKSPMSAPFLDFPISADFVRFRRFSGLERRILRNLRFCRQSRVPPWFSKKIEDLRFFLKGFFLFSAEIALKSWFAREISAFSCCDRLAYIFHGNPRKKRNLGKSYFAIFAIFPNEPLAAPMSDPEKRLFWYFRYI